MTDPTIDDIAAFAGRAVARIEHMDKLIDDLREAEKRLAAAYVHRDALREELERTIINAASMVREFKRP